MRRSARRRNDNRQRPYSIRTRIKTSASILLRRSLMRQRPYSIRTRIKTRCGRGRRDSLHEVRDHIPLEQGLRLVGFFMSC